MADSSGLTVVLIVRIPSTKSRAGGVVRIRQDLVLAHFMSVQLAVAGARKCAMCFQ
jgi:hypothetical protein